MDKQNIFIGLVVVLVIVGLGLGVYFNNRSKESELESSGGSGEEQKILERDEFSINIPEGWEEGRQIPGVLAIISNLNEENDEPILQEAGFRSYFAIVCEKADGVGIETYVADVKAAILASESSFRVVSENQETINNREGYVIEAVITQQEIDFKIFMVVVKGMGNDVWLISFNTVLNGWERYKDIFEDTIKSFIILKEMTQEESGEKEVGITILESGDGPEAKSGDTVTVDYQGMLEDGTKFDSSIDRGEPFVFTLGAGQVIQGWDIGIEGMKIGETRKLVIPSELAYGEQGTGASIPPNAVLIFEVKLLGISN